MELDLASVLESMAVGVFMTDATGAPVEMNRVARNLRPRTSSRRRSLRSRHTPSCSPRASRRRRSSPR
jgi:hypothetical protein